MQGGFHPAVSLLHSVAVDVLDMPGFKQKPPLANMGLAFGERKDIGITK